MASGALRPKLEPRSPISDSSDDRNTPSPPKDPTEIPEFCPSMEEFKNFPAYIAFMESKGAHLAGIAKIIPPSDWCPRPNDNLDDLLDERKIKPVIQQRRTKVEHGVFTQYEVNFRRKAYVEKFKEFANTRRYRPKCSDIDEIKRRYLCSVNQWRSIYGAVHGTLFDNKVELWNIRRLGSILDLDTEKSWGVTKAHLHFGVWMTTSCWRMEDGDSYSINYLHVGAEKFWYAVPPRHGDRLENLAASYFPESSENGSELLRHKAMIIAPKILQINSIPVLQIAQKKGEFIVTFPGSYHASFDMGYNCAESTNFWQINKSSGGLGQGDMKLLKVEIKDEELDDQLRGTSAKEAAPQKSKSIAAAPPQKKRKANDGSAAAAQKQEAKTMPVKREEETQMEGGE